METAQRILDVAIGIVLALGCVMSLPIYWALLRAPFIVVWDWWHARKRGEP